jgi:uncharacterized protein
VRLENSFEVAVPVGAAWRLLNDVPSVVSCLPGATLVAVVDEHAWKANLQVKLGPIALQFATDVTREEMDEESGRVVLATKAREVRGKGGAQATIESRLSPVNGGTRVDLVTDLALQGAVAQHGRGIVGDVASRLTTEFAECIAARLDDSSTSPPPQVGGRAPIGGLRLLLGVAWRRLFRR